MVDMASRTWRPWKRFVAGAAIVVAGAIALWASWPRMDPVQLLAAQLREGDAQARYQAAKQLEELGPNALAAVERAGRRDHRRRAASALSVREEPLENG